MNFVLKFGFGVYLANSIILIFALVSGFHKIAALVQSLISCCSGIPVIVQIVYLGIYRFNWAGSACSEKGAPYEHVGRFMLNMFIA